MANVDNSYVVRTSTIEMRIMLHARRRPVPNQELGNQFNRPLRGGEADALRLHQGQRFEPFQRQHQVSPALIRREGVDFIDNDGANGLQQAAAFLSRQENEERLRCRHQNMRRPLEHLLAIRHWRVTGAHQHAQFRQQQPGLQRPFSDLGERLLKIFLNVIAQRLQRRDVEHMGMVVELTGQGLLEKLVDAGQKSREGFA